MRSIYKKYNKITLRGESADAPLNLYSADHELNNVGCKEAVFTASGF